MPTSLALLTILARMLFSISVGLGPGALVIMATGPYVWSRGRYTEQLNQQLCATLPFSVVTIGVLLAGHYNHAVGRLVYQDDWSGLMVILALMAVAVLLLIQFFRYRRAGLTSRPS